MKWEQLYGSMNILSHCLSLGLELKLTFSSPVANGEFWKFASILSVPLPECKLMCLCSAHREIIRPCWPLTHPDTEAGTPILWPPDTKNWLIDKDPHAGKDWRQEKGITEDEMVGWHHQFDGQESEQALGVGDRQENLACCRPCGHKEWDTTEQVNWTEHILPRGYTWRCFARLKTLFTSLLTASPSLFCLLILVPHCFSLFFFLTL